MQTIIYKKTYSVTTNPVEMNWKQESIEKTLKETLENGTILLVKKSEYDSILPAIYKIKFVNCEFKKEKIELFRSLKFDQKTDRYIARRLIADFTSMSAFNRSFSQFFNKHYTPNDPPCVLFVTDERVDELVSFVRNQPSDTTPGDPMTMLLSDTSHKEILDKISRVFIGESPDVRMARTMICKAALSKSPVLILGESGTGKELIAQQVYEHSVNYHKKILSVNCSALPEALLESELFGHTLGSFTGAVHNKEGLFSAANGGTLFLDEIGDLSLANQAKVLRVIEEKEIRPVGAIKSIKVDVRIIAATNRNLFSMMKQKTFREDLYFRLNSITIFAPPLREHPDDIPRLASIIWAKLNKPGKLSDEFLKYLMKYSWPGNVRELKTLLNTISDWFGNISPGPEHIEAIRSYQKKILSESHTEGENDFNSMLKSQCRNRIIEVQNILRKIKVEFRPIINKQFSKVEGEKLHQLKNFIEIEVNKLDDMCREPIFFKNRKLFERITRFRYLLEKTIAKWPSSSVELGDLWQTNLTPLYEQIDSEIFEIIWGKMDL